MSATPDRPCDEGLGFRRLLVALDGSPSADLALVAAITAARRENAKVTLLAVVPDVAATMARWPGAPVASVELQREADDAAQGVLRDAIARIPQDIPVTTITRQGKPGPEIVAVAAEGQYDAILLGARGVGRVGALAGSVSQHVMHHAKVAVIVAHAPAG